ncbi:hypothetical protein B9Z55_007054 [Caenorhabditis nigoni]|uniref:Cullin family profile domain-containing protein n=1 Tax=Caenorhabditis nigoni TaxID=1611254 RepID=A0A2G5V7Z7_9PELO|nr:hypothetical protein B9Z55_007054 [Caenorhabditis nigoni]
MIQVIWTPTLSEEYVTQTWEYLKSAIQAIQRKNDPGPSFEELYRSVYTMVLHKHGDRLYNSLREVIREHMEVVRVRIIESMDTGVFLETMTEAWTDHIVAMTMISEILMYLDRMYVPQKPSVLQVYDLGLELFRTEVLRNNGIENRLIFMRDRQLDLIKSYRKSNEINWHGIKNLCKMLISLGIDNRCVYEEYFEKALLKGTYEYYREVCETLLAGENDVCFYLEQVETAIRDEANRASRYLDKETEVKILQVVANVMVADHMSTIVHMPNGGVKFMFQHKRVEDLRRIFRIFKHITESPAVPVSGRKVLLKAVSEYLTETGTNIMKNEDLLKVPVQFVNELLQLQDHFSSLLTTTFDDDREFKKLFQHDFETLLNSNRQSPEFLAHYMDDILRSGLKCVSDAEMDDKLDNVMVLFRCLHEKDVFEKYFKKYLAKRLLLDKSSSDDVEKALLAKLKTECGCQFTQKLENMFRDKELWLNLANSFRDWLEGPQWQKLTPDISVRVLTAGVWPTVQCTLVVLPPELAMAYDLFTAFYNEKHTGRKLTINTLLGNADVKATFYPPPKALQSNKEDGPRPSNTGVEPKERKPENKILQVSTHQMIILLQFNHHKVISCQQLLDELKMPEKELKRCLYSLALSKSSQRILTRKGPKGRNMIDMSDEFMVDDNFQSKLTRVKVQMVSGKVESEPEIKETRQKVEDDRKLEVEAAIVRTMKTRKRLNHNNLVTEVTQQLRHRFMPSPTIIKQRIETLIEREFLRRDEHDPRSYSYMA